MGFLGIPGTDFLTNIDFAGLFSNLGYVALFIIASVIIGSIAGIIYYFRLQSKRYNITIHWFEEVQGTPIPIGEDKAREMTIPGTSIIIFYIKSKDLYLPRGTLKMGKNSYWYFIRRNREIVNFTLKNMNLELAEAGLNFDHNDARLQNANLEQIIKRNYRDKSVKWWKEYKEAIILVLYIFVLTLSFFFIAGKIGTLISAIEPLLNKATELLSQLAKFDNACQLASNSSGIIQK